MRTKFPLRVFFIVLIFGIFIYSGLNLAQTKNTLRIKDLMGDEEFKKCGLHKLTEGEIENLNNWLTHFAKELYALGTTTPTPSAGGLEKALLFKDFDGDKIIIRRSNDEMWILEAKTWCSWCWKEEGNYVYLKFGYVSSKLINDDGEICEFWTGEQLE